MFIIQGYNKKTLRIVKPPFTDPYTVQYILLCDKSAETSFLGVLNTVPIQIYWAQVQRKRNVYINNLLELYNIQFNTET